MWCTAQLHERGLDIDDCCSLHAGCADEGNELVHIVRHVFPSKEIEDAEAYVHVAMIQFLSDPSFKQFHACHKTYMRSANAEFRSLITYKKRVADSAELSDPLTMHTVAAMQNIHIGVVFESTYWCTREDGKLWDCDIVMACLQDPEGTRRRRFICIKKLKCEGHTATLHVAFQQSVIDRALATEHVVVRVATPDTGVAEVLVPEGGPPSFTHREADGTRMRVVVTPVPLDDDDLNNVQQMCLGLLVRHRVQEEPAGASDAVESLLGDDEEVAELMQHSPPPTLSPQHAESPHRLRARKVQQEHVASPPHLSPQAAPSPLHVRSHTESACAALSPLHVRSRTEESSAAPSPRRAAFTKLRPQDVPAPKPVRRPVSAALGRAPSTDADEPQHRVSARIAAQPKFDYIVDYPLGEGADFEEVQRIRMSGICEEDEPAEEQEPVPAPSTCSSRRAAPKVMRTPTPEWDLHYKAPSMCSSCRAAPKAMRTPTPEWDLHYKAPSTRSARAAPALCMPTPEYNQPKIKCKECEAGFEHRALLWVHLEEAHAMYLCTTLYCKDYFVSEQACADHYAANHARGQFHCDCAHDRPHCRDGQEALSL